MARIEQRTPLASQGTALAILLSFECRAIAIGGVGAEETSSHAHVILGETIELLLLGKDLDEVGTSSVQRSIGELVHTIRSLSDQVAGVVRTGRAGRANDLLTNLETTLMEPVQILSLLAVLLLPLLTELVPGLGVEEHVHILHDLVVARVEAPGEIDGLLTVWELEAEGVGSGGESDDGFPGTGRKH